MKKQPNGKHNQQKELLERQAAQRLLSYLARNDHGQRYLLGPHREAPDFSLRVLDGTFRWRFLGLEVTHLYANSTHAAAYNGSLHPPRETEPEHQTLAERLRRLDKAIRDKNDKYANYELKPCWLLIHNADGQIGSEDWRHYLQDRDFSASPYEKIWLIAEQQQIINIK
jgi:hypothetical protein